MNWNDPTHAETHRILMCPESNSFWWFQMILMILDGPGPAEKHFSRNLHIFGGPWRIRLPALRCQIISWIRMPGGKQKPSTNMPNWLDSSWLMTPSWWILILFNSFLSKESISFCSGFGLANHCFDSDLQDRQMRELPWCHQQRRAGCNYHSHRHEARPKSTCPVAPGKHKWSRQLTGC